MKNTTVITLAMLVATVWLAGYGLHLQIKDDQAAQSSEPEYAPPPTMWSPKVTANGKEYHQAELVADFLRIAFSETLWNHDTGFEEIYIDKFLRTFPKDKPGDSSLPWLSDYFDYPDDWPAQNVINKWTGDITIGIDFPAYTDIPHRKTTRSPHSKGLTETYPVIEARIRKLVPEIADLSGLPVTYVPPRDEREQTEQHARIRIVPVRTTDLYNFFKTLRLGHPRAPVHDQPTYKYWWEWRLWGAVPFTPLVRSQVDGFFLPKSNNEIGLAICLIVPDVGPDLFRALVTECIVRSLGLPDLSERNDAAIIGNWNAAYDDRSKLPWLDGWSQAVWFDYPETAVMPFEQIEGAYIPDGLTDYDRMVIKMLYCPDIKPGMSKLEVLEVFGAGKCLPEGDATHR